MIPLVRPASGGQPPDVIHFQDAKVRRAISPPQLTAPHQVRAVGRTTPDRHWRKHVRHHFLKLPYKLVHLRFVHCV